MRCLLIGRRYGRGSSSLRISKWRWTIRSASRGSHVSRGKEADSVACDTWEYSEAEAVLGDGEGGSRVESACYNSLVSCQDLFFCEG